MTPCASGGDCPHPIACGEAGHCRYGATRAVCTTVEAVRSKLKARAAFGLGKYGVTLADAGMTRLEWLQHAQNEAMDLANYLEVLIQQEPKA